MQTILVAALILMVGLTGEVARRWLLGCRLDHDLHRFTLIPLRVELRRDGFAP